MAETNEPRPKHKLRVPRARRGALRLFIGTRKGTFVIEGDATRKAWEVQGPWHLGSTCFHVVSDPRHRAHVLAAVRTPLGRPAVMVSRDGGASWEASERPPAFSEEAGLDGELDVWSAEQRAYDRSVNQVFWLSAGHAQQPGTWFAGTSPQGLFRSDDGGRSWAPLDGLHRAPEFDGWTSIGEDRTPDGPKLHSVLVDPRDSDHMFAAMSTGGVVETRDGGASWARLQSETEAREGSGGGSDPHRLVMAATNPDLLWMQSKHGVFKMETSESRDWEHVGSQEHGDAGFPIAVHPADPDVAWVVPMDDSEAWTRMPKGGRACVLRTLDGGRSWERLESGLPRSPSWWTVKRQCLTVDGYDPVGVYFGTSSGEVWGSIDEGTKWKRLASGLPHVYSVEAG